MLTRVATPIHESNNDFHYNPEKGLKFSRHFTHEDISPFDQFEYEDRASVIREPTGKIIFEMQEVEVPKKWSQVATDILAQKYFRKTGVPLFTPDGSPKVDDGGKQILGSETTFVYKFL